MFRRHEFRHIDDVDGLALDDGRTHGAGRGMRRVDGEGGLHHIHDLIHGHADLAILLMEDQHRLAGFGLETIHAAIAEDRHQLAAILRHRLAAGILDRRALEFLETANERKRDGLEAPPPPALKSSSSERSPLACNSAERSLSFCATLSREPFSRMFRAMPAGSRIRITEPSPRMVAPE